MQIQNGLFRFIALQLALAFSNQFEEPSTKYRALVDFMASLVGAPDIPYPRDLNERISSNMNFFFKHEYKTFIQYILDVNRIRENKVSMIAAVGRDSDDAHYIQSTKALASKLHCECIEFPGQHDVSSDSQLPIFHEVILFTATNSKVSYNKSSIIHKTI